jgi:CO dehydrogenase maturation factor
LIILSDPSIRSLETARRVVDLVGELKTKVAHHVFAFTRVPDGVPAELLDAAKERDLPPPLAIPEDAEVGRLDSAGKPLVSLPSDSRSLQGVRALLRQAGVLTG